MSARVSECQKIITGGLDQYGPEHYRRRIVTTVRKKCGNERVNKAVTVVRFRMRSWRKKSCKHKSRCCRRLTRSIPIVVRSTIVLCSTTATLGGRLTLFDLITH